MSRGGGLRFANPPYNVDFVAYVWRNSAAYCASAELIRASLRILLLMNAALFGTYIEAPASLHWDE